MSGLSRLRNMFRVPDLRNKVFFTIFIIFLFRVGSYVPVPYVDFSALHTLKSQNASGALGSSTCSGRRSPARPCCARIICPHHVVDHHAAARRRDPARGVAERRPTGQKKITQWALPHRGARADAVDRLVFVLKSGRGGCSGSLHAAAPGLVLIHNFTAFKAALIILTWTAGTAMVLWFGGAHHPARIGNGMSILISHRSCRAPFSSVRCGQAGLTGPRDLLSPGDDPGDRGRRVGQRRIPVPYAKPSWAGACTAARALHPAQGQPVRRDPGDLRQLAAVVPAIIALALPWQA